MPNCQERSHSTLYLFPPLLNWSSYGIPSDVVVHLEGGPWILYRGLIIEEEAEVDFGDCSEVAVPLRGRRLRGVLEEA